MTSINVNAYYCQTLLCTLKKKKKGTSKENQNAKNTGVSKHINKISLTAEIWEESNLKDEELLKHKQKFKSNLPNALLKVMPYLLV